MVKWVKCSERLPDKEGVYLTVSQNRHGGKSVFFHNYNLDYWVDNDGYTERQLNITITHWAELPEPPNG